MIAGRKTAVGLLALALLLSGLALTPTFAAKNKHHPQRRQRHQPRLSQMDMTRPLMATIAEINRALRQKPELKLTADQNKKIREIVRSHRKELNTDREAVSKAGMALHQAIMAQTPDTTQIRSAADALGKAIGDQAVAVAPVIHDVRGVLTADQLKQVQAYQTQIQQGHKRAKRPHKAKKHQKKQNNQNDNNG